MIEQIENNLSQKISSGVFIMITIGFFGLVLSQPYISEYLLSFVGAFVALMIASFFVLGTWKLKEELESEDRPHSHTS
tara:strand:+ start:83 stop:316 length:234 start_codon:yes stop_codon:yes gene_type:complete